MKKISVVILTFNSQNTIEKTLNSVLRVADDIHIVDSFSQDKTLEIVDQYRVSISQRQFTNYSDQRNWAINTLKLRNSWQLHLDSDESLSNELVSQILDLEPVDTINGYFIPRLTVFLGRPIYHGGMYPIWHMRLFRSGKAKCEDRLYDQHFQVIGETGKLLAPLIDDQRMSISEWSIRHNKWSDMEAEEISQPGVIEVITGNLLGNPIEKKRKVKEAYYHLPLFFRAFLVFLYRYFLRFGFLDGREGLIYFTLQTLWFRFLVDAKIYEKKLASNE